MHLRGLIQECGALERGDPKIGQRPEVTHLLPPVEVVDERDGEQDHFLREEWLRKTKQGTEAFSYKWVRSKDRDVRTGVSDRELMWNPDF